MNFTEFLAKYNGQQNVGNTPENMGQCVGLVELWATNLGSGQIWGNADDLLNNADKNFFDVIVNTPTTVPVQGDIIVWGQNFNGTVGHCGIATGTADTNTFECFEANDPTGSNCHLKTYNYNSVLGWLRVKSPTDPLKVCLDQHTILVDQANQKDTQIKDLTTKNQQLTTDITTANGNLTTLQKAFDDYKASHQDAPTSPPIPPSGTLDASTLTISNLISLLLKKLFGK